jgi:hypothetical protein
MDTIIAATEQKAERIEKLEGDLHFPDSLHQHATYLSARWQWSDPELALVLLSGFQEVA